MKKFLKIVLFAIFTLSLINISDTKINYLNNNNEVEKVKSPKKNAYGNESTINNLTDLSYTEWHQTADVGHGYNSFGDLYSNSNTQVKVCDIINNNNREEKKQIYTNKPNTKLPNFSFRINNNSGIPLFSSFYACTMEGENDFETISFYSNNIIKFYDMSTFTSAVNDQTKIDLFLNCLKNSFNLYVEDQKTFVQVSDNFTSNREELDKNFKCISIKGLEGNYKLNEKIDISSILNNQNINELEIYIVYNDLPTTIYNLFNVNYPILSDASKKYTLSGNIQKQYGNLTRTLKFTINNRDCDGSILEIYFFT